MFVAANFFRRRAISSRSLQVDDGPDMYEVERRKSLWEVSVERFQQAVSNVFRPPIDPDRPLDYYINPDHHEGLNIVTRTYLNTFTRFGDYMINEIKSFNNFVTFTICMAGIVVGLQTYDFIDSSAAANGLDSFILSVFTVEVVLKVWMEGLRPLRYFYGPEWKWNWFDFLIVFFSFPFWESIFRGGSSIALLRLVRLLRLGKLIRRIPALQTIMRGLADSMNSVPYILVLIFLIYYLYGVVGYYLFSDNDPFHFSNIPMAMITLFRLSTLDNWGDIFLINYYGCDVYQAGYWNPQDETPRNKLWWCRSPNAQPVLAMLYFISAVILNGLVMISLFVGAIMLSMGECMDELDAAIAKKKKALALKKARMRKALAPTINIKGVNNRSSDDGTRDDSSSLPAFSLMEKDNRIIDENENARANSPVQQLPQNFEESSQTSSFGDDTDGESDNGNGETLFQQLHRMHALAQRFPILWPYVYYLHYRTISEAYALAEYNTVLAKTLRKAVAHGLEQGEQGSSKKGSLIVDGHNTAVGGLHAVSKDITVVSKIWSAYSKISDYCALIVHHPWFSRLMTLSIIVAGLNVGAQTDDRLLRQPDLVIATDVIDYVVVAIFTVEAAIKIVAEGTYPLRYFYDHWNKFDFLIVVGSYITGSNITFIRFLRLLRVLRVIKLVRALPQLGIIVGALFGSLESIFWCGLVCLLNYYVWAIIAVLLYRNTDPWHFGNLHRAMLTLFRLATLDNSTEIQYISMFGCERYPDVYSLHYGGFPWMCRDTSRNPFVATLFFTAYTVITAQIFLNMFVGVICNAMSKSKQMKEEEESAEIRIEKLMKEFYLAADRVDAFRAAYEIMSEQNGTLEQEELKAGLDLIDAGLDIDQVAALRHQVIEERFHDAEKDDRDIDDNDHNFDCEMFIRFMFKTPLLADDREKAAAAHAFAHVGIQHAVKKGHAKGKEPWYQFIIDYIEYGGTDQRLHMQNLEAAFIVQEAWNTFKVKREATRVVEMKKLAKGSSIISSSIGASMSAAVS